MMKNTKTEEDKNPKNIKIQNLAHDIVDSSGEFLTTDQGLRINDNQNSLKSGERGSTLLEDFILREKITHFDHERIPERIVHARGAAAHGYFQLYESQKHLTKAIFLQDTSITTPVFVRFSTVAGSRGSSDLARDVRGFSVKFYTEEGNYDLVGNNMPVFFIQDAIKFPDLIHAVKPEPNSEIPQASSAHDTFWDFISLMPESTHMIMWLMSDRALPRSFRMMEGFGVHTFRFINEEEKAVFVKFHWKPVLGVHAVAWDEAQKISGKDPDFHRRDLCEAIEKGAFPEWELGIQVVEESDEHKFEFDLLDPTKLIPEEIVPVKIIGKMTLNRNPDNYFSETEQVAFHPGHLVSGIDFTNDPLLQGRLFSYTDTQLSRLGSPNFNEIPINRPIAPVHNNHRDGHMRQTISTGRSSYEPNTVGGGCPFQAKAAAGGFTSHAERIDAHKIKARSKSFLDHFSQATLFYNSQSVVEKAHIQEALCFELGKLTDHTIQIRMLEILSHVDETLAQYVANQLGLPAPRKNQGMLNHSIPADTDAKDVQPVTVKSSISSSKALSMENTIKDTIKTRKVAILAAHGFDDSRLTKVVNQLEEAGATTVVISTQLGNITSTAGKEIKVNKSFLTTDSVLFDAIYIPGGTNSIEALQKEAKAIRFIQDTYRHCKAIAADNEGAELLYTSRIISAENIENPEPGLLINSTPKEFIKAIAQHRVWKQEKARKNLV